MTCLRGASFSITSAPGAGREAGSGPRTGSTRCCGRPGAGRPVPPELVEGAAIIGSQPVKTTEKGGPRGYGAGKKVNGGKRHIVVDTLGLLLAVAAHPADIQDWDGARLVLQGLAGRFPRLQLIWAGGACGGKLALWAPKTGGWSLELVRRPAQQRTFQVLPRRWAAERTCGWLNLQRRLSKDCGA